MTEISHDGHTISTISHEDLKEPIDVALDIDGNILVADNGVGSVLVFDPVGKLLRNIGSRGTGKGQFKDISALTVAPSGEIVIADSRIQVVHQFKISHKFGIRIQINRIYIIALGHT